MQTPPDSEESRIVMVRILSVTILLYFSFFTHKPNIPMISSSQAAEFNSNELLKEQQSMSKTVLSCKTFKTIQIMTYVEINIQKAENKDNSKFT